MHVQQISGAGCRCGVRMHWVLILFEIYHSECGVNEQDCFVIRNTWSAGILWRSLPETFVTVVVVVRCVDIEGNRWFMPGFTEQIGEAEDLLPILTLNERGSFEETHQQCCSCAIRTAAYLDIYEKCNPTFSGF